MDFFDDIEDYKQGTLEPDKKLAFEKEMAANKSLRMAVENHDLAKEIASGFTEIEAAEIIEKLYKERSSKTKQLVMLRWASIAAVVLLVISSIFVLDLFRSGVNYEQLAHEFFESPKYGSTRSGEPAADLISYGRTAFAKNDFAKSDSIFSLLLDGSDSNEAKLYLAYSRFQNNDYTQAQDYLSQISDIKLNDQVDYLDALTYLGKKEVEKAKEALILIMESDSKFSIRAKDLLAELE